MTLVHAWLALSLWGAELQPPPAGGPPPAPAVEAYRRGVAAYKQGSYDEAIEAFKKSYELTGDPELQFNIAQAYQHKPGGCRDAERHFRVYAQLVPTKQAQVAPLIDAAAACAARDESAIAAVQPVANELPAARRSNTWKYLLIGGAATAVAGTLLVWSVSWDDDCRPLCQKSEVDGLRDRANVGYVLWALGGVAGTAGLVLRLRGSSNERPRAWLQPQLGGVGMGVRF